MKQLIITTKMLVAATMAASAATPAASTHHPAPGPVIDAGLPLVRWEGRWTGCTHDTPRACSVPAISPRRGFPFWRLCLPLSDFHLCLFRGFGSIRQLPFGGCQKWSLLSDGSHCTTTFIGATLLHGSQLLEMLGGLRAHKTGQTASIGTGANAKRLDDR